MTDSQPTVSNPPTTQTEPAAANGELIPAISKKNPHGDARLSTPQAIQETLAKVGAQQHAPIDASPKAGEMTINTEDLAFSVSSDENDSNLMVDMPQEEAPSASETQAANEHAELIKKARRQYLAAQKADRKAREQQRLAHDMAQKATQFQSATQNWQQDPVALLQQAGIDPRSYIEHLVKQGASQPAPDPVEQKIQSAVAPYVQALEQERAALARHQELVAESNTIATQVRPLLDNQEQYEVLLHYHDGDANRAAITVYNAVKDHWQKTYNPRTGQGEIIDFAEAANQLEKLHAQNIELGIKRVKDMRKYSAYFNNQQAIEEKAGQNTSTMLGQTASKSAQKPSKPAAPKSSTLTNQHIIPNPTPQDIYEATKPITYQAGSKAAIAETFRKLGLDSRGKPLRK